MIGYSIDLLMTDWANGIGSFGLIEYDLIPTVWAFFGR